MIIDDLVNSDDWHDPLVDGTVVPYGTDVVFYAKDINPSHNTPHGRQAAANTIKAAISLSKKFHLTDNFLQNDLFNSAPSKTIISMSQFCKLPFPLCSIYFQSEGTDNNNNRLKMKCVAVLSNQKENMIQISIAVCRDINNIIHAELDSFQFNPSSIEIVEGGEATYVMKCTPANDKCMAKRAYLCDIVYDFLVRINQPHLIEEKPCEPLEKLNKARAKSGKKPLHKYSIIDLSKDLKIKMTGNGEGGQHRLHWRRGHFKQRKSGIFWWSHHMAGRKELGEITSEYVA